MSSKFDRDLIFKFGLVQAKLAVVASSGDVLSDLNDLKEAKKLETDLAALISKNHKKGLVPQNPLAFIESEINLLANWGKDVQGLIDLGDDLLSPEQLIEEGQKAGIEKMRQLQLKIEVFQSEILPKAADLRSKIPKQCFKGKLVDQRIRGIWQLKLTADDQTEEIPDFTNLIQWVGETDKAQFKVSELNEKLSAHLKLIEKLYAEANEQLSELDQVLIELECGSLSQAKKFLSNEFNANRFFDARDEKWGELTSKINDLESSLQNIKSAGDSFKIIKAVNAVKLNSEWSKIKPDSELGLELNRTKRKAERDRLIFCIGWASVLLLVSFAVYYTVKLNAEMEEKFRLGRVAAANEEANAAAKAEAERIAAAEKAELERIAYLKSLNASLLRANISQDKVGRLLKKGGTVVAWGSNSDGQSTIPQGLGGVVAIAMQENYRLALKSDGTVVAWGDWLYEKTTIPQGLSGVVAIAAGGNPNLALKGDGTVVAWGNAFYDKNTIPQGLNGVVAIAVGSLHELALKSDGTVVAWGSNRWDESTIPQGLSGVVAIAAGGNHSLALKSDGTLVAWGSNESGESTIPQGLNGVVAIAAGGNHNLALKSDGTVVAWGNSFYDKNTVPQGLNGVVAIAAGSNHNLALKSDGTVVAWGSNRWDESTIPQGLSGVVAIAAGGNHSLALKLEPDTKPDFF